MVVQDWILALSEQRQRDVTQIIFDTNPHATSFAVMAMRAFMLKPDRQTTDFYAVVPSLTLWCTTIGAAVTSRIRARDYPPDARYGMLNAAALLGRWHPSSVMREYFRARTVDVRTYLPLTRLRS